MDHHARAIVGVMKKKWVNYTSDKTIPDFQYRIIGASKFNEKTYHLDVEVKFHKLSLIEKLKFFFTTRKQHMKDRVILNIVFDFNNRGGYKIFGIEDFLFKNVTIKFF
jgi:hypothetical protein